MSILKNSLIIALAATSLHVAAQPAPVPTSTPAVVVTLEQKAAVAEMLEAINFKQMMTQMGAAMAQSMPKMIEQQTALSTSKLPPEAQAKARNEATKSMQSSFPRIMAIYSDADVIKGMEDIMASAYAKRFTLAEIKAITAFYASDAGKKMQSSGPQIMQETMPEIMALVSPRMNAIVDSISNEAKEKAEAVAASAKTTDSTDTMPAKKVAETPKKTAPTKK